jgi:hypothetical protein
VAPKLSQADYEKQLVEFVQARVTKKKRVNPLWPNSQFDYDRTYGRGAVVLNPYIYL